MIDEKGFYGKYIIEKADGSPVDPKARYVVLRYDKDNGYCDAARTALFVFANLIKSFAPKFSFELRRELVNVLSEIGKDTIVD